MKEQHRITGIMVSLLLYLAVFALAFVLAEKELHYAAGAALCLLALAEYFYHYGMTRQVLQMEGVFALFWTGGAGLSAFKLSRLAGHWSPVTFLCIAGVYVFFVLGYELWLYRLQKKRKGTTARSGKLLTKEELAKKVLISIYVILIVSVVCFLVEASVCEIPLFSDKPHAYSYFHISGVHYFTVTGIFGLPLAVIYKNVKGRLTKGEWLRLIALCAVSLSIPVLCVSRFQLMLAVFLAMCVEFCMEPRVKLRYLIACVVLLIPAYALLTVARNHDVAYLNGIFEMKNPAMPIFITQPYMYVANNYDNFNCLVTGLESHTMGLRQLFPLFALSGLKFIYPQLVSFPLYITKAELTTVTMIYDAFYDFGVIGVFGFGLILGIFCCAVAEKSREGRNPVAYLFYGQIVMYLVFSFFTTWYSNPTTWFWLVITGLVYVWTGYTKKLKH